MGLFGIGDYNRMILDVPVRYAPVLGLPYDPADDSVFEKSGKKINIVVSKGKGVARAESDAVKQLMEYGIPYQAARSMVGVGSKKKPYKILDDSSDPGWEDWRLDELSPEEVAEGRGRTGMLRAIDVAAGTEYGQRTPRIPSPGTITTPFELGTRTGEQVVGDQAADPFRTAVAGDESKSIADAIAAMEVEQKKQASKQAQEEAERKAWELRLEQEREAAAEAEREARTRAQIEA